MIFSKPITSMFTLALAATTQAQAQSADVFTNGVVIRDALCVGENCPDDPEFGKEEIRLEDFNIRVLFKDASQDVQFPSGDWRLVINDTVAGGSNHFSIEDRTTEFNRRTFRLEAGAPPNALVINNDGKIGFGTRAPVEALHIVGLDTPAIRLEQNALDAPPWDIGSNEMNFFVRNARTGTLPLRIRPGAPTNALFVDGNGQVGMGLQNPKGALHVRRNQPNNVPHLVLQNRREGGRTEIWFQDRDTATDDDTLRLQLRGDDFNISFNGTGGSEFQVAKSGDVRIFRGDLVIPNGAVIVGGTTLKVPDYVFAPDYDLMPLGDVAAFIDENAHLPHVPSAAEIAENGLDMTKMQLAMLKSHEELVLHVIEMRAEIDGLKADLAAALQ